MRGKEQGSERERAGRQEVAEAASALATELLRCEGRKKTRGGGGPGLRRWAAQCWAVGGC